MKNIIRKMIIALLVLGMNACSLPFDMLRTTGALPVYADEPESSGNAKVKVQVRELRTAEAWDEAALDMWHYSGSYWIVGSGRNSVKILDRDIDRLEDSLDALGLSIELSVKLPQAVEKAIDEGLLESWTLMGAGRPLSAIADPASLDRSKAEISGSSGNRSLSFSLTPRFTLSQYDYDYFIDDLNSSIRLIDSNYGYNLYSIFGNGKNAAEGYGSFSQNDPFNVKKPYIHPSQIADADGHFAAGGQIMIGEKSFASDGFSVGDGTFRNAGAVGYHFRYVVGVKYSYYELVEKEIEPGSSTDEPGGGQPGTGGTGDPGSGGSSEGPGSGSGEPGTGGGGSSGEPGTGGGSGSSTTGSGIEEPGGGISGPEDPQIGDLNAVLQAPDTCYEGHSIIASDCSDFDIGGEYYSAQRAYRKGLASATLGVTGGSGVKREKLDPVTYKLTFASTGSCTLRLNVQAGEKKGQATSQLTVLSTPALTVSLGGRQKENRKQTLSVAAAQNPKYPITSLTIEIRDKESGETIHLEKVLDGRPERPGSVTQNIKSRALKDTGSDQYYVLAELDFLSKFTEDRVFEYTVMAKDSRGRKTEQKAEFTVLRDKAPEADIALDDCYYRVEAGEYAVIEPEDRSVADGDQLSRSWYVDLGAGFVPMNTVPGYRDLLFGSGQKVAFNKTGVGNFKVRLQVTDLWTEETLPEFINASDHKSAEATASSHVDNIAPVLSLEMRKARTAEILLLSENAEESRQTAAELEAALKKEGISAGIRTEEYRSSVGADEGTIKSLGQLSDLTLLDMQEDNVTLRYGHDLLTSRFWGCSGGMSGMFIDDSGSITTDGKYVFRMQSTPQLDSTESHINYYTRVYPYTLSCKEIDSERLLRNTPDKWSLIISETVFRTQNNFKEACFVHDYEGLYLGLVSEGRTLLIDKSTGSILGTIEMELGKANTVLKGCIYSIKGDGIYKISLSDGHFSRIFAGKIQAGYKMAAMIGGKLHFVIENGEEMLRGIFDPSTESVETQELQSSSGGSPAGKPSCLAVDSRGRIVLYYPDGAVKYYDLGSPGAVAVAAPASLSGKPRARAASFTSSGECNFAVMVSSFSTRYREVTTYYGRLYIYDLETGTITYIDKSLDGEEPLYDSILSFAVELKDARRLLTATGSIYESELFSGISSTPASQFTIDTSTGKPAGSSIFITEGISAGHGVGFADGGVQLLRSNFKTGVVDQLALISEPRDAEKERLIRKNMNYDADYCYVIEADGRTGAEIAAWILESGENRATLKLEGSDASGSFSRSLVLKPGIRYYYEYDTDSSKDILSIDGSCSRAVAKSALGSGVYSVHADHQENFNNESYDSFFAFDKDKVSGGAFVISRRESDDDAYYLETHGDIKFTVPEGCLGFLSFKYGVKDVYVHGHTAGFLIGKDGALKDWNKWAWPDEIGKNGTYYHTDALESGEWTLRSRLRVNAENHREQLSLDDLRVIIIRKTDNEASLASVNGRTSSVISNPGGLNHVQGIFSTAFGVSAFEEYPVEYYRAEPNGIYSTETRKPSPAYPKYYEATLNFSIPDGKKAAFLKLGTASSNYRECGEDRYDSIIYSWYKGKDEEGNNTYQRWRVGWSNSAASRKISFEEPNFTVHKTNVTAETEIKSSAGHYYLGHTWANFAFVEMALVPKACPSMITAQNYVMDGSRMLIPNVVNKGTVRLSFGNGGKNTEISGFRLYYMENGRKIYVMENDFSKAEDLNGWSGIGLNASAEARPVVQTPEAPARVYKKGEPISYQIYYYDYEDDPSKRSYWRYTYIPFGPGGEADESRAETGQVLPAPVISFNEEGKYIAEHWQEDDASRGTGDHSYDKLSNVCSIVFYVSSDVGSAPWVESIKTTPSDIEAGQHYGVQIKVDDADKDPLTVRTEIYYDTEAVPVYSFTKKVNDNGSGYPAIDLPDLPEAKPGTYTVVVIVSDESSIGMGEYSFSVKETVYLGAEVKHTEQWEENRKQYNDKMAGKPKGTGSSGTYKYRPENMFWPGESLVLQAELGGSPISVTAVMVQHPQYTAVLRKDGSLSPYTPGHSMYSAEMWSADMQNLLGKGGTENVTIRFTAKYSGGKDLVVDVPVIFDQSDGLFWQIHRYF